MESQDLRSGNTRSVICIVEAQDLHSGNTRSVICIEEAQDLYSGTTRSVFHQTRFHILMCTQDASLMNHTSQEWLNGVHLFTFHKKVSVFMKM